MLRATAACNFAICKLQKSGTSLRRFVHFDLKMCFAPQRVQFCQIQTSKSGPPLRCFVYFELKMCFAPQAACNFQTSKSGPPLRCFVHVDLQMCFVPQRRAILGHPNFQKSSDTVSFLVFLLENVLRATAACNFSCLL